MDSLRDFELKLAMKNRRIEYFHGIGRISEEEYEKWILSDDINFEPLVCDKEEFNKIFSAKWNNAMKDSSFMWQPETENKLLKIISTQLDLIIEVLHEIKNK